MSAQPALADEATRLESIPWQSLELELDARGFAVIAGLLTPSECRSLAGLYGDESLFRSRIVMARYGFGSGEFVFEAGLQ